MGNDLAAQTETNRRDILRYAVFSPADLVMQPGVTIRVPVFFILGLAAALDHSHSHRFVRLRQLITGIGMPPVELISEFAQPCRGPVTITRPVFAMNDQHCPAWHALSPPLAGVFSYRQV
jgi:hypothetical protein